VKASRRSPNLILGLLAFGLWALVIGLIALLATGFTRGNPTPAAPPTRVVPGANLTAPVYPSLPPEWTATPVPTASATQPTDTPSPTAASTLTPTFAPTDTPIPTATGPTPTRRPSATA
jgi:hypothetical protein